jgi:hypothetical protein
MIKDVIATIAHHVLEADFWTKLAAGLLPIPKEAEDVFFAANDAKVILPLGALRNFVWLR